MLASPASSLLSPLVHPRFADGADPSAGQAAISAFRLPFAADQAATVASGDDERSGRIAKAARHLVRHALRDFRHELKDTLDDLGFGRDEIRDIVRGVMAPVRDALKSGQSFGAQVMVAAATQVSIQGAGVQAQSFNLAVDALEIQYNHETGEVTVSTVSLDVAAQTVAYGGAAAPQLFDISDGAALPDLGRILDAIGDLFDVALPAPEEDSESEPVPQLAAAPLASERVQLTEPAEPATQPIEAAPAEAETAAPAEDDAPAPASAPAEKPRTFARISVDLFEQFANAHGQMVSRMRLRAQIPLGLAAADVPVPALPVDPMTNPSAGPVAIEA
jgi:chemotaxis protein histidine kinase CheA